MRRYLALVPLLLFALFVSASCLEAMLRLVPERIWMPALPTGPYPWIRYDPITGFANRANFDRNPLHLDNFGLRSPDTTRNPHAEARLVCMGDSRTFGIRKDAEGMPMDNAYPAFLQELLGSRAEVLNAGVIGYTSATGLAQLHSLLIPLHPSAVIVSYGVNDHCPDRQPALAPFDPPKAPFLQTLFDFSARMQLFRLVMAASRQARAPSDERVRNPAVPLPIYQENLRRIVADARRNEIRVVFLTQALRPRSQRDVHTNPGELFLLGATSLDEIYALDSDYRRAMIAVANGLNVPVADGAAAIEQWQGEPLFGPDDMVHVNPLGAKLLAKVVRDKLADLGWLPTQ